MIHISDNGVYLIRTFVFVRNKRMMTSSIEHFFPIIQPSFFKTNASILLDRTS